MNFIVQFSGGMGSYLAAQRAIARYGRDKVQCVFADTKIEDEDLYRFLGDAEKALRVPLHRIADGRTPWEVFHDVRFLGNTRIDPCSRVLKRDLLREWIESNFRPETTTVVLGIGWSEIHRLDRATPRWKPWTLWAPLCESPYLSPSQCRQALEEDGIPIPRLYTLGFPHNNCGGFCVKAGISQFKHLLKMLPERYAEHEAQEQVLREKLGDVSILRDRRGGTTKPLTLKALREREIPDDGDWGGCGCAIE